jgi:PTS system nitrogen regulatory IIA component
MRLSEVLKEQDVRVGFAAPDKDSVLRVLARMLAHSSAEAVAQHILDEEQIYAAFADRERIATTADRGVALPHAWLGTNSFSAALVISTEGVPFDSEDGQPVHIAVAILAPQERAAEQVKLVARSARALSDQAFCARLRGAASQQDALEIWSCEERRSAGAEIARGA